MILSILQNIEKKSMLFFDFYLFLIVAIVIVIIKINNPSFVSDLLGYFKSKDILKVNTYQRKVNLNFTTFALNFCYILLISFGLYSFLNKNSGFLSYLTVLIISFVFYLIQVIGIYVFEKLIDVPESKSSFFNFRTSYNETITVIVFPIFVLFNYVLPSQVHFYIFILVLLQLVNIVRTSIYLDKFISIFHIILYLCSLEMVLILFWVKYLSNIGI